ncbi:MAG: flagellar basal body-associated FliL family protein [Deltaproteobacteria bacterium]|nr:flagellar basal body-associated FliL family protein [Deltaproteobacteria bacterium]
MTAVDEKNDQINDPGPDEAADDQIMDSEELFDEANLQNRTSIQTKKVELDIEELPEELTEEEREGSEREGPDTEGEEERDQAPEIKTSRFKLFLVGIVGGVFVILVVACLILFITLGQQNKAITKPLAPAKQGILKNLEPFIVNYHSPGQEVVLKLTMTLRFSSLDARQEFDNQRVVMRDLIYRFLESRNSADLNKRTSLLSLQKELAKLINSALTRGRVEKVLFQEFLIV